MEKLLRKKKYLEAFIGSLIPPKVHQHFSYGAFREADSNFSSLKLCPTNGQANSLQKAKTKAWPSKQRSQ